MFFHPAAVLRTDFGGDFRIFQERNQLLGKRLGIAEWDNLCGGSRPQ